MAMARSGLCRAAQQTFLDKRGPLVNLEVAGLTRCGQDLSKRAWLDDAIKSSETMLEQGVRMSRDLAYSLVEECSKQEDPQLGRRLQSLMSFCGRDSLSVLADRLIRVFTSCGDLVEANEIFEKVLKPSQYTWNAIIRANAKLGKYEEALHLYDTMLLSDVKGDSHTFVAVLQACIATSKFNQARRVHHQIINSGIPLSVELGTTLVHMYAKCGDLEESSRIFSSLPNGCADAALWNTMITAYVNSGNLKEARRLFDMSTIKNVISWTAMVTGYAKHGNMKEAQKLFDKSPQRDPVSWGALIGGYAEHGEGLRALECFSHMRQENINPDKITFLSIVKACASIGAIDQGREIHLQIIKAGFESDLTLQNALAYMYAMCGKLEEAHKVWFTSLNEGTVDRDVVSWNAIIAGHAQRGHVRLIRQCLKDMQQEGIKPNETTFSSILAACSHASLLDEGCKYFKSMTEDYGIIRDDYHYTCMVDLLGRAGKLKEAENLLQTIQPSIVGWISLLVACRTYQNVEIGRRCFDQVVKLDPKHATGYVIMAGIYSDAQMPEDAAKIEELRKRTHAWKKPAKAWIEVDNKVHEFIVGDKSHPQSDQISETLRKLSNKMREMGYIPKVDLVLTQMSDQEKQDALCGHAEKLAVAFGLANTPPGTVLQATKNLRVCMDCHNATKIISKIEGREIIIRDAYHMHHFKNGSCSCGDYY